MKKIILILIITIWFTKCIAQVDTAARKNMAYAGYCFKKSKDNQIAAGLFISAGLIVYSLGVANPDPFYNVPINFGTAAFLITGLVCEYKYLEWHYKGCRVMASLNGIKIKF